MSAAKRERNARLLARRRERVTYRELASEFGISLPRAHVICWEETQRELMARLRSFRRGEDPSRGVQAGRVKQKAHDVRI